MVKFATRHAALHERERIGGDFVEHLGFEGALGGDPLDWGDHIDLHWQPASRERAVHRGAVKMTGHPQVGRRRSRGLVGAVR